MANLSLQDKLNTLQSVQSNIQDGYRLYSDGSIKTITITESSETGWYLLARPVSGAATVFLSFFPDGFLKTNSMREAIMCAMISLGLCLMIVDQRLIAAHVGQHELVGDMP